MTRAEEGDELVRKSEKKGKVVPRADEIAKTGEKGAHRAFSPAPAGRGGGSCCLPPENLGSENLGSENLGLENLGPENLGLENLGRPIAQLQPPPW